MSPVIRLCGGSGGEDGRGEGKRGGKEHGDEVTLLLDPCWSSAMELSQISPGIKPLRLARRQEEEPWL